MLTMGHLWWLIVLAVLLVMGIWYWTTTASHRVVERITQENPKLYTFRYRYNQRRKKRN